MTQNVGPKSVKKRPPNYAKQKKAFDNVLSRYRALSTIGTMSVSKFDQTGKATPNLAKPNGMDFLADCQKVIEKVVPAKFLVRFWQVYIHRESEELVQEMLSDKVFGARRHSWEQRCGAEFIKRGIYPVQQKYFNTLRRKRKNL